MDTRVQAIRRDPRVGDYSCSVVDECWGDGALAAQLDYERITTVEAALKWAYEQEGLHLEQGLNQRWGEDNDSQLVAYQEWKSS